MHCILLAVIECGFSALTLIVELQKDYPAYKNLLYILKTD